MGSIPKIVSTPIKWASKKILHQTLLRFPGGDQHSPIACVYCPEMCRFSCPTAVVSGNDVVTPCNKMGLLYKEEKWPGRAAQGQELWPLYDCTGCGRCTEYCVYDMPVAAKLFEARRENPWSHAIQIAADLTDTEDQYGDLADELGDEVSAKRRVAQFSQNNSNEIQVSEPKALYFLKQKGFEGSLKFEKFLDQPLSSSGQIKLSGKTWLLHESVWHSRHLEGSQKIQSWLQLARDSGAKIRRPFAQGHDCIDCGGEGIYHRLFPSQSLQMAREIWERDRHRADGILCVSQRCAEHFRRVLQVPVLAFSEVFDQ